jgi:hypothetical protein
LDFVSPVGEAGPVEVDSGKGWFVVEADVVAVVVVVAMFVDAGVEEREGVVFGMFDCKLN